MLLRCANAAPSSTLFAMVCFVALSVGETASDAPAVPTAHEHKHGILETLKKKGNVLLEDEKKIAKTLRVEGKHVEETLRVEGKVVKKDIEKLEKKTVRSAKVLPRYLTISRYLSGFA